MAMAMRASVTVSMLADTMGVARRRRRVRRVVTSTSPRERMPLREGTSSTSSYESPRGMSSTVGTGVRIAQAGAALPRAAG